MLRAGSVILVLLAHLFPHRFSFGILGVDIFFVVSGYCITSSLCKMQEKVLARKLITFYLNRVIRLFPSIILTMVTSIIVFNYVLFEKEIYSAYNEIFAALLFYSNFFYMIKVDYFSNDGFFFTHFWSLSTEEQYYFFFPLIYFLLTKLSLIRIFIVLFLVAVVFHFYNFYNVSFYNPPLRFCEIFIGSFAATTKLVLRVSHSGC